jgi:hypothetical protein
MNTSVVTPMAKTKPVTVRLIGETYSLVFYVCQGCGGRVGLVGETWEHRKTSRAECGAVRGGVVACSEQCRRERH